MVQRGSYTYNTRKVVTARTSSKNSNMIFLTSLIIEKSDIIIPFFARNTFTLLSKSALHKPYFSGCLRFDSIFLIRHSDCRIYNSENELSYSANTTTCQKITSTAESHLRRICISSDHTKPESITITKRYTQAR